METNLLKNMVLTVLISLSAESVLAYTESTDIGDCIIGDIQIIEAPKLPLGSKRSLFVRLNCNMSNVYHMDHVNAPITTLEDFTILRGTGKTAKIELIHYNNALLKINDVDVGPVQPTERPELIIGSNALSELISSYVSAQEVFVRNSGKTFEATDAAAFKISMIHREEHPAHVRPDGKIGFGSREQFIFDISGSLEIDQNKGEALVFSEKDSLAITKYLGVTTFPIELNFSNKLVKTGDICIMKCESQSKCQYQETQP